MANPEHVKIALGGSKAIDAWQEEHPGERLELRGADLERVTLENAYLSGADLQQANLHGASLTDAVLTGANLCATDLGLAKMERAYLMGANLAESNLTAANLAEADFSGADLSKATLVRADMTGTRLFRSNLSQATLGWSLAHTDLREVKNLVLDGQDIQGTRFSPRANDPWSTVRTTYTGAMLLFHLMFLVAFLTPYGFRALKWSVTESLQKAGTATADSSSWPMWQLLLGWDKGWYFGVTGMLLIAYNVLRAAITWWLSQLREAEERSGYAPVGKHYLWCFYAHHYFMRYVFWLAMASGLLHIAPWLGREVITLN